MPDEWKDIELVDEKGMLEPVDTKYDLDKLKEIAEKLINLPEGKKVIRNINRLLNQRKKTVESNQLDWAMAELLAYGSSLEEGHDVRLSEIGRASCRERE